MLDLPIGFICKLKYSNSHCTEVNGFFVGWILLLFGGFFGCGGFFCLGWWGFFVLFIFNFCYLCFHTVLSLSAYWLTGASACLATCIMSECSLTCPAFLTERSFSEA